MRQRLAMAGLVEACRRRGIELSPEADRLPFPPLNLDITVTEVEVTEGSPNFIVRTVFEAAPVGKTAESVRVNAVGYGPTLEEAMQVGANQWLDGVFPVLHSFVAPHPAELDVETAQFLAGNESGERFAWRVHLGPVLVSIYGEGPDPPHRTKSEILQALMNEVSAIAAVRNPFWLELFAGRLMDGQTATTCLLRNTEWLSGDAALAAWVRQWPSTPKSFGNRQFIFFEPVGIQALPSLKELEQHLERHQQPLKKSWWRKLLGA